MELGREKGREVQFEEVLGSKPTKFIAASGLSNLLHLVGAGMLELEQQQAFGVIHIRGDWALHEAREAEDEDEEVVVEEKEGEGEAEDEDDDEESEEEEEEDSEEEGI